jgi:hypothetical protein
VIRSTYSRSQLGLNAANRVAAFLFLLNAEANSAGVSMAGLGCFATLFLAAIGLVYRPLYESGSLANPAEHELVGG